MSRIYLLWCRYYVTEICLTLQSYRYIKEVCVLIGFHGNNFVITFCYVNFCFATRCKSSRIMENHGKSINYLNPPHLGQARKKGVRNLRNRNYIFYNPSIQISLTPLLHFYRFYTIMYINRNTCTVLGGTDRRSFRKKD